jgi:hypothetical protein
VDLEFAYDADDRKVRKGDSVLLTHDTALAFGVHVVERVYRKSGVTKVALDFGGRRKLYVLARNVRVFNVEE